MKKIIRKIALLGILLASLGFVTFGLNEIRANPPCPENCHLNCANTYIACKEACGTNNKCIKLCQDDLNSCNAYCDWVCGPQ